VSLPVLADILQEFETSLAIDEMPPLRAVASL
jgi:hypothetical protein